MYLMKFMIKYYVYGTNRPQVKRVCVYHTCACTHVFACYMYTHVAACCTIQSHASASVTHVSRHVNRSIHFADIKYTGEMNSMWL